MTSPTAILKIVTAAGPASGPDSKKEEPVNADLEVAD